MKTIQNVTYRRDPELPGVEVCRVRRSRHAFPNHLHEGLYAIGLMEAGGAYCLGPQRSEAFVAPGEVALINPAQVHSGVPPRGVDVSYRMIYLDLEVVADLAGDLTAGAGGLPEFSRVVVRDADLARRLRRLYRVLGEGPGQMEKTSVLLDAAERLMTPHGGVRQARSAGGDRQVVRRAQELLSADLDRKISLEEVARAVGLSRYHLLRVFKQATGVPPHVFRTQRRIDRARDLLRQGRAPAQVALESGFSDQSHFINKFRQFVGATPGQYLSGLGT